jgi:lipoprotein-anchoring transpeptidase ErfK/SrfK
MRRLVAIPVKSSVVVALLSAGALYVAADIRQSVIRRYQSKINMQQPAVSPAASLQSSKSTGQSSASQALANPAVANHAQSDEVAAEQQIAKIAGQKPARKSAPNQHPRQIVVSIADRKLAVMEAGQVLKIYPIAVGARTTPSPEGDFVIINHAKDPAYSHNGKVIEPGKNNPLGSRWMGLSQKGYGIHGTNVQSSVGKAASHGCFRMRTHDVEELYSMVQVGDKVTVRRQRDAIIAQAFSAPDVTLEAKADTKPDVKPAQSNSNSEVQVASAATATADDEQ